MSNGFSENKGLWGVAQSRGLTKPPLGRSYVFAQFLTEVMRRSEESDLVHQTLSANRSGTWFDLGELLVPVLCCCCSDCTE